MKRALLASIVAIVALAPLRADAATSVESAVDRSLIGLGEIVRYSVTIKAASGDDVQVTSVQPGKLDGFDVLGKNSMPTDSMIIVNGKVQQISSFTVTYILRAKKLGVHVLGPGRFVVSGKAMTTPTQKVEVVASAPPKKPKDPFHDFFDDFDEPPPPPPPEPKNVAPTDPLARVEQAEDPSFFARVVPHRTQAMVGEQVTLKLFVYAREPPKVFVKRPPVLQDFRHVPLGGVDKIWQKLSIGDDLWMYGTLEAFAAFPLKPGKLTIGPAIVEMIRDKAFGKQEQFDVETKPLELEVIEPPLEGRPAGYVLGDVVADLEVAADVAPRTVSDGHALITLKMKGAGRLDPLRPHLPTPPNVTWTTTGDETRTRIDALTVYGERKLQIDAKFDRAGDFDLGEAVMHVWDPKKDSYATLRATLGKVHVDKPADTTQLPGTAAPATLPPPRGRTGKSGEGKTIADRPWTWGLVFGAPTAVVLGQAAAAWSRRRRERNRERAVDPGEQARAALAEARSGDRIGGCIRALDRAVEAATGVRPRGLTKSQLSRALEGTKLEPSLREDVLRAFERLESARFAGGDAPSVDEVGKLVERVLA